MSVQALQATDPPEIGGHRLLGRLGAGGMGVVYLARSRRLGLVAVKVIKHDPADPEAMERFRREAATLRGLRSPYVAPLVDARVTAPPYWLATAYVRGPTLLRAVAERGPLPAGLCRRLLAGLAAALADVHRHGVQHRDLKPHNVILSPQGPRLIDFGIARAPGQSTITTSGEIVGTPGYIAPEAVRQEPVTAAADVFALAGTIAYAATGRPPFGRGEPMAVLYSSLNADIDVDGVEPALAELIRSCAGRDPAERITSDRAAALAGSAAGPLSWASDAEYQALVAETGPTEDNLTEGDPAKGGPGESNPAETDPAKGKPVKGGLGKGGLGEDNPAEGDPAEDKSVRGNPGTGSPGTGKPAKDDLAGDGPTGAAGRTRAYWSGPALAVGAVLLALGATAAVLFPRLTTPTTGPTTTPTKGGPAAVQATMADDPGTAVVTQPPPDPTPAGPVRWQAVHGPRCTAEWFYADPAWRPVTGGWKGDGCAGAALALRVGGVPAHFNQVVNWYFDTRGGARCTIDVHIPDDPRSTGLAFYYLDGDSTDPPHLGPPVTVDQRAFRGRWAPLGTWRVPAPGRLTVLVGNQPVTADDTHEVTVSAARARCRW
ncbi:serine/threonine-protein kinase [Nonomuraea sp. NPDC049646]|uniref:serine/threonine-protein kinase n=1 Tax=unclassified Nonomuraea TaxID=2593643 RepID=UPI0037A597EC